MTTQVLKTVFPCTMLVCWPVRNRKKYFQGSSEIIVPCMGVFCKLLYGEAPSPVQPITLFHTFLTEKVPLSQTFN